MSASTIALSKVHYSVASFVRPNDNTQYTAGDVICNAATLVFPGALGVGGILNYATIVTSNNATAKPTLELWLFDTTIAAVADNAAFAPTDAEMLTLVGVVRFESGDFKIGLSGAATNGNAVGQASNIGLPMARTSTGDLYGQLVDRTAAGYIPIAQEAFKIRLGFLD